MKLKVVVGVLVLIIMGLTVFGDRGLLSLINFKRDRQALVREASRVKAENERLRDEIERLKSDKSYIERIAREELGMVKPGEVVFQFTDNRDGLETKP